MSDKKIYWYVLFVKSGSEEKLVEKLKNSLDKSRFHPFVLQKTCVFRRKGEKSLFQKVCFPGYVFIESELSSMEFISYAFSVVYNFKEAYRFLNYGDKSNIAMRDEEQIALSKFFGKDHNLGISSGIKEGDFV